MDRIIRSMEKKYLDTSLELVNSAFSEHYDENEGKAVCGLVKEIRAGKYYMPELEFIMVNERDEVIGYAMFSRFHLEGRFDDELLILTPVAVKTELQRQHISKELIEHGFELAVKLGFKAVLIEGDPKNYVSRGFAPSYRFGVEAGKNLHLPHPDCLMLKELYEGAADNISGFVDYGIYKSLQG